LYKCSKLKKVDARENVLTHKVSFCIKIFENPKGFLFQKWIFSKGNNQRFPLPQITICFFFVSFFWGRGINFVFENFGLENFYTGGRHFGASRIWGSRLVSITLFAGTIGTSILILADLGHF